MDDIELFLLKLHCHFDEYCMVLDYATYAKGYAIDVTTKQHVVYFTACRAWYRLMFFQSYYTFIIEFETRKANCQLHHYQ